MGHRDIHTATKSAQSYVLQQVVLVRCAQPVMFIHILKFVLLCSSLFTCVSQLIVRPAEKGTLP